MCNGFFLRCNNLVLSGNDKSSGKQCIDAVLKFSNKKSLDGKIDTLAYFCT